MFTGLVENVGILKKRDIKSNAASLTVSTELPLDAISIGDSIANNGACLTVERKNNGLLIFHASAETLKKTTLGQIAIGEKINLERAMQLGDRLGGHMVSGHIDCITEILDIKRNGKDYVIHVKLPKGFEGQFIDNGSVTVDGISLTVVDLMKNSFSCHIIPHTWAHTSLVNLKKGGYVNIETDLIGKYILRNIQLINNKSKSISMESLANAGFFSF